MLGKSIKNRCLKTTMTLGAALITALGMAGLAQAACGEGTASAAKRPAVLFAPQSYRPAGFVAAAYLPVTSEAWNGSIVGLWEFQVHATVAEAGLPVGGMLDWGLATWHDDGTEIQFSAGRPYTAGDVCMGAWKPVGPGKFQLNHIALGMDLATGATFDGLTNIRATVTVSRDGNSFSGPYTIIQYSGNPADGTEFDQSTVLYTLTGWVTAKRVTADY